MNTDVMFSSATDEWATPQDFFDKLNEEFHFETDVCATPENAKCARYFTREQDGLKQEWGGDVLDESSLWEKNRPVGSESVGILPKWRDGGVSASCEDGHRLVA